MEHTRPTLTFRLHAPADPAFTPESLRVRHGLVLIVVDGVRYAGRITSVVSDHTGCAEVDMWMERELPPGGPDGPVLLTLDDLVTSHARTVAEEYDAAAAARHVHPANRLPSRAELAAATDRAERLDGGAYVE